MRHKNNWMKLTHNNRSFHLKRNRPARKKIQIFILRALVIYLHKSLIAATRFQAMQLPATLLWAKVFQFIVRIAAIQPAATEPKGCGTELIENYLRY